jgi:YfiH family protein
MHVIETPLPAGSLPLLVSPVFPPQFRHGFTTRAGGVSGPPFESLNLGRKWGDDSANVDENHRRLLAASGTPVMYAASQVHGARILHVRAGDDPVAVRREEADGLCSDSPNLSLAIYVADCVPVLLADPVTGAFAALHSGWRGTVAGVVAAGVNALADKFGSRPTDLRAALGPAIGPCCFEVGPEVVAAFEALVPDAHESGIVRPGPHKPHVDLRLYLRLQLLQMGVRPEHIDACPACTFCDGQDRFYSYRRFGRATGQMVGFVGRA